MMPAMKSAKLKPDFDALFAEAKKAEKADKAAKKAAKASKGRRPAADGGPEADAGDEL